MMNSGAELGSGPARNRFGRACERPRIARHCRFVGERARSSFRKM